MVADFERSARRRRRPLLDADRLRAYLGNHVDDRGRSPPLLPFPRSTRQMRVRRSPARKPARRSNATLSTRRTVEHTPPVVPRQQPLTRVVLRQASQRVPAPRPHLPIEVPHSQSINHSSTTSFLRPSQSSPRCQAGKHHRRAPFLCTRQHLPIQTGPG